MTTIEVHEARPFGRTEVIQLKQFEAVSAACAFAHEQRQLGRKHIVIRAPYRLSRRDCDALDALGVERL